MPCGLCGVFRRPSNVSDVYIPTRRTKEEAGLVLSDIGDERKPSKVSTCSTTVISREGNYLPVGLYIRNNVNTPINLEGRPPH